MTFAAALKKLPFCLVGGVDLLTHKTVDDLRYVAQHEIDLYEAGDIDLAIRDLAQVRKFLATVKPYEKATS